MTLGFQVSLEILIIIMIGYITYCLLKNRIIIRYALPWLLMLIVLGLVVLFPKILSVISGLMGIKTEANMIFFVGFCFVMLLMFSITMALTRCTKRIKKLTQELALLEHENRMYREGQEESRKG